jgi:hypothetical protein
MLLKWLFTILALIWLYQALRPYFLPQAGRRSTQPPPTPPPPTNSVQYRRFDEEDGEYIDYEEVKK